MNFDFGQGLSARGFAALRETASLSLAGFALFRRNRLVQGSADEGYRPETIFGKPNSYSFQRLFGELHLDGFEVSHTKDGFKWDDQEEAFLEFLKEHLDSPPTPLLDQAEGHRVRGSGAAVRRAAERAASSTAEVIRREVPPILSGQLHTLPELQPPPDVLPAAATASRREIDVELGGAPWRIVVELSSDPAVGDWITIGDSVSGGGGAGSDEGRRRVTVRLSLAHPFMERFGGATQEHIEPLLRVAAAIALAETAARCSGVRQAGTIPDACENLPGSARQKLTTQPASPYGPEADATWLVDLARIALPLEVIAAPPGAADALSEFGARQAGGVGGQASGTSACPEAPRRVAASCLRKPPRPSEVRVRRPGGTWEVHEADEAAAGSRYTHRTLSHTKKIRVRRVVNFS